MSVIAELTVLRRRIDELQNGECRQHCRTAKENWLIGYRACAYERGHTYVEAHGEVAYNEWKRRQAKTG